MKNLAPYTEAADLPRKSDVDSANMGGTPSTSSGSTYIVKSTDEVVNNSAVMQNDDHLFFTVDANSSYRFEGWLLNWSTTATPDVKIGWTVPAGTTMMWGGLSLINGTATSSGGWVLQSSTSGVKSGLVNEGGIQAYGLPAASNAGVAISGIIRVGANAGTVQLQWAQNIATAETTLMLKDSHLIIKKLI